MELDLISATVLMAAASLAAVLAGWKVAGQMGPARIPLFAVAVLATSLYASCWAGRLENVVFFPVAPAVILSNLTPVLACFLAGFAWGIPGAASPRQAVVLFVMVALGGVFLVAPLLRPLLMPIQVLGAGRWTEGICMQTHAATCGPAAAATLLRHHGIDASERALVSECLTSRAGTEPLALYRALVARTRGAGISPRLASARPEDWMKLDQFPVLAMVAPTDCELRQPSRSGRLCQLLGRTSEGHAVVILGRDPSGDYLVGDPASGHSRWDAYALSRFFTGQAIYLSRQGR